MKNILAFGLIFTGIILLACDTPNMTAFYLSKIYGVICVFIGCVIMPKSNFS